MGFINWLKGAVRQMFSRDTIKQKTGAVICIDRDMREALEQWDAIYHNKAPWLNDTTKSLNLGAQIAAEFARLITLEMKSEVTGTARAEYINTVYQNMIDSLQRHVERACAVGGMAIKPYLSGGKIQIDFADNTMFYPTAYDTDGDITGAVFVARKTIGEKYYTKLELHEYRDGTETIRSFAYESQTDSDIGRSVPLSAVPEWARLAPEARITNLSHPLFTYFSIPTANTANTDSPLGASVYARATDLLKEADKQWSRLLWEFEGGELAVHIGDDLLAIDDDGNPVLPKGRKRLYRVFSTGGGDKPFYETYSPALRDDSLINGLNTILKRIEFNCSLAYGTLSDPQNVDKTAEEIRASKQRSYSAVCSMQKSLERALRRTADIINVWCTIGNLAPEGEYEVSCEWDDSIVSDRQREFAERQALTAAGCMQPWELRMWYLGESEETAKKMTVGNTPDDEE